MCGIIGYTGVRPCLPVLLEGLEKLEYRGYDSTGVAWPVHGDFQVVKAQGRLTALRQRLDAFLPVDACCGIGHTRWATHGAPSDINSHPHRVGRVCLVHNGIVENHAELRQQLLKKARQKLRGKSSKNDTVFVSDTDTEVLARLIDEAYDGDAPTALRRALCRVRGSYALAVLFADQPGRIWAVHRESPLIVGLGGDGCYLASDLPALLSYTQHFILPEEDDIVLLSADGAAVFDSAGRPVNRVPVLVDGDPTSTEKNGFPHYMLKEIFEQPEALHRTIEPRIRNGLPCFTAEGLPDDLLQDVRRIRIVGCGTALHAGMVGRLLLESLARIPAQVEIASEFRYADPAPEANELLLLLSQSGETLDTLASLRLAKQRGYRTLAIVNTPGSAIAREADHVLLTHAGPEIAVASTKAYTTQLAVLYLLAIRLALLRGAAGEAQLRELTSQLTGCSDILRQLLHCREEVQRLAGMYFNSSNLFFLGRGLDHAVALEASLKLREISYIHSEGCAAGELKHGSIALIAPGTPVVALATQSAVREKLLSNLREVRARGARVLLLCPEGAEVDTGAADQILRLPPLPDLLAPLAAIVPLQLFAYEVSLLRGCDVDRPRNLAKSVTVE